MITDSGWLDLAILALAFAAAISGWFNGAVASALSLFGVGVGVVSGLFVAPYLAQHVESPGSRLVVGLAVISVMVLVGQAAGTTLGRAVRGILSNSFARLADSAVGAALQGIALLIVAWLIAIPVAAQDGSRLASAVRSSRVLEEVNKVAPEDLQQIPAKFADVLGDSGLPDILGPFASTPMREVSAPDPALAGNPIVASVRPSVVKVLGRAEQCSRALEGSGFVFEPHRVMTNAHVVAGTDSVKVETVDGRFDASVVLYDPRTDIAILDVPQMRVEPLVFAEAPAETNDDVIILGYPANGPYHAAAARIRESVNLRGPSIYRSETVEREVYTLRGTVREGNSGGPVLAPSGSVLGVIFGAATDTADTAYALTVNQVMPLVEASHSANIPVNTQGCVGKVS